MKVLKGVNDIAFHQVSSLLPAYMASADLMLVLFRELAAFQRSFLGREWDFDVRERCSAWLGDARQVLVVHVL